jgi:NDP-sugar pyrophosphorylase family protein
MKVLMACAGMNTELRPFTDMMPKCLLPVKAKPILFHNLEWLKKFDISEVVITTSYYHNQIELALKKFQFENFSETNFSINVHKQKGSVGTAQSLNQLSYKFDEDVFLFLHGGNLYDFDIENYYKIHKNNGKPISILSHMSMGDSKYKNFIKYKNGSDKIEKISVRPDYKMTKELLATSGACYLSPAIFDKFKKKDRHLFDDIIPKQLDDINVIVDNTSVRFINTPREYLSIAESKGMASIHKM